MVGRGSGTAEYPFATTKMGKSCERLASERGRAGLWCSGELVANMPGHSAATARQLLGDACDSSQIKVTPCE